MATYVYTRNHQTVSVETIKKALKQKECILYFIAHVKRSSEQGTDTTITLNIE